MLKPKKELGQNFLVDKTVTKTMVENLQIEPGNEVIEIGPGLGALTETLIQHVNATNRVYLVEYDPRFIKNLEETYSNENVKVVNKNILDWLPNHEGKNPIKIIGSLPYYITSPILHHIVYMKTQPTKCVLLIQKEVAQKIVDTAPSASYLSTFIQTFFKVDFVTVVPKESFDPIPKVDGAIITLTYKSKLENNALTRKYEGFLHKAFANPRKMLNKAFSEEELRKGGIDGALRPQNLSPTEWVIAFKKLL